ncbi:MAG TPA: FecR domain-containing protein [Chryseosolibacter sp.]
MKKTNLDKLLERYIQGQVTDQEKMKIEAWLDVKKTEEGTNLVLDDAGEEKLFRKITANIDNAEEIRSFRPRDAAERAFFRKTWFRAAASLLLLIASSYTIWHLVAKEESPQVFVAAAGIEKVILRDGTIVWLHKGSRFTFAATPDGERTATLRGEGLFEVAKDPSRPFIISCGEASVKVVGTSFNLKSDDAGIELKVLTGRVRVSTPSNTAGIVVIPNEEAVYRKDLGLRKSVMERDEAQTVTARTDYNMAFKNTAIKTVIGRIESKFDVDIVLENPNVNDCRITADFTDHSLESTLLMIRELLDIDYTIEKSTVTIQGSGCN